MILRFFGFRKIPLRLIFSLRKFHCHGKVTYSSIRSPQKKQTKNKQQKTNKQKKSSCLRYISSSSSCRAVSTDIPDPLSSLLPIVHCFWQVLRATSRILTELLYVDSSWSSCFCSAIWRGPFSYGRYIYIYLYIVNTAHYTRRFFFKLYIYI